MLDRNLAALSMVGFKAEVGGSTIIPEVRIVSRQIVAKACAKVCRMHMRTCKRKCMCTSVYKCIRIIVCGDFVAAPRSKQGLCSWLVQLCHLVCSVVFLTLVFLRLFARYDGGNVGDQMA